jgi:hypothetical protein
VAAVVEHYLPDPRQPQPRSVVGGAEAGLEDQFPQRRRDPGARVEYLEEQVVARGCGAGQQYAAGHPCSEGEGAAPGQRVDGIGHQVVEQRADLLLIHAYGRQAVGQLQPQRDVGRQAAPEGMGGIPHQAVQVQLRRGFGGPLAVLALQVLQGEQHAGQRVLDVVRDAQGEHRPVVGDLVHTVAVQVGGLRASGKFQPGLQRERQRPRVGDLEPGAAGGGEEQRRSRARGYEHASHRRASHRCDEPPGKGREGHGPILTNGAGAGTSRRNMIPSSDQ